MDVAFGALDAPGNQPAGVDVGLRKAFRQEAAAQTAQAPLSLASGDPWPPRETQKVTAAAASPSAPLVE